MHRLLAQALLHADPVVLCRGVSDTYGGPNRRWLGEHRLDQKVADLVDRYLRDVLPDKPKEMARGDQERHLNWWRGQIGHSG